MNKKYSVLMSVYIKENPEFLKEALDSIFNQTVLTDDLVLVCDGPLTNDLEEVIKNFKNKFCDIINVIRLEKNMGLGFALNEGLKSCKNELVARMDTDDISLPNRCELQLKKFEKNKSLALISGKILEFQDKQDVITGSRVVPLTNSDIINFSKRRNPFNHPAVMFKKSVVEAVGGYDEKYHLFEDYYLWVRILNEKYFVENIGNPLLLMRTPSDLYLRRGGYSYARDLLKFNIWMKSIGWISSFDFILSALPHAIVCILPNFVRKIIYQRLHS
ncbi:amylovoran biosynthesis protein AmsE [Streptococcus penaeicida]|uniref:Amylovoran biosynthesis protein AmsE n=1 Tax=Streptococcus penaeicida TaxID=1765960 RepID=A0A2N8LD35_9STRE|nr:glycosyltransferase [Streptococcus penaeicida]PND48071.1 amylovoran biosynthesis protein AmsE [Streptococcus penaeicida]